MKQKNKMKYFCISVVSVCTVIVIWFLCINVFHMKSETVFPVTGKSIQYVLR